MNGELYSISRRLDGLDSPSVWLEFSPLAVALKAINLGQGFPDWPPPPFVVEAATDAMKSPNLHTYARSRGHPSLSNAIAKHYSPRLKHNIDPDKNIIVTVGSSQALSLAFQSMVSKDDEVVLIEPCFDLYFSGAKQAGATIKYVPLRGPKDRRPTTTSELKLDIEELKAAITPNTRMLVLNSPHNPTGKVFSREELNQIAEVIADHPKCVVLSDEVYEHLTYDGEEHVPFCTIPRMWERTLTLCSAGKTFSVTGWKIGWAIGPPELVYLMQIAQQWNVFSVCTPLQDAVAKALDHAVLPFEGFPTYYDWLREQYNRKRSILISSLKEAGLQPIVPQGSFFVLGYNKGIQGWTDVYPEKEEELVKEGKIMVDPTTHKLTDYNFCRWLVFEHGISSIPMSAFYCNEHKYIGASDVRFAFCKSDELLKSAAEKFIKLKSNTPE